MASRPSKPKGEQAPREAAEQERQAGRDAAREGGRAPAERKPPEGEREASDPREDEGWSQPESSAQKDPGHRQE